MLNVHPIVWFYLTMYVEFYRNNSPLMVRRLAGFQMNMRASFGPRLPLPMEIISLSRFLSPTR